MRQAGVMLLSTPPYRRSNLEVKDGRLVIKEKEVVQVSLKQAALLSVKVRCLCPALSAGPSPWEQ